MKEYEYMVLVTDEIFSHIITSVICLENYTRSDLSGAFRKLFSLYNELREEYYELKRDVKEIPEEGCTIAFEESLQERRNYRKLYCRT